MQDDIDTVSGQAIPLVPLDEQYRLAERMVRLLDPDKRFDLRDLLNGEPLVMCDFTRRYILERQMLDYEYPFDE